MKTVSAKKREELFRKDWEELLEKHGAEAEYDVYTDKLEITMRTKYKGDDEEKEFCQFEL